MKFVVYICSQGDLFSVLVWGRMRMKRFRGQESVAAVAALALVLSGAAGLGFKQTTRATRTRRCNEQSLKWMLSPLYSLFLTD